MEVSNETSDGEIIWKNAELQWASSKSNSVNCHQYASYIIFAHALKSHNLIIQSHMEYQSVPQNAAKSTCYTFTATILFSRQIYGVCIDRNYS